MMKEEELTFSLVNDEGETIECEALATFNLEETGKDYIVYTDNTLDDEGNTKVYASTYEVDETEETTLLPVTDEKEWALVEKEIDKIYASFIEETEGCADGCECGCSGSCTEESDCHDTCECPDCPEE